MDFSMELTDHNANDVMEVDKSEKYASSMFSELLYLSFDFSCGKVNVAL